MKKHKFYSYSLIKILIPGFLKFPLLLLPFLF
jgi:hypothetical protein